MVGRPPWGLGCVAFGVALLAVAGCSRSAPTGTMASAQMAAAAQPSNPASANDDGDDSAQREDPAVSEPPLPSTARDERTLAEDHPYRSRHGLGACEIDCSVHEAGYKWAALHSLHDARYCAGLTPAFVEGCRAYVGDHRG
ncbi:MAG TPA: hypothetical protein VGH03_18545 [Caulobacteraceae bacterium]|jgi:hypothetical protein